MTKDTSSLMTSAREALENNDLPAARRFLRQATRLAPDNYRAWMWLSGITDSPAASLQYAKRAFSIAPQDPSVRKAVDWANQRIEDQALVTAQERKKASASGPPPPIAPQNELKPAEPIHQEESSDDSGVFGWLKKFGAGVFLILLGVFALTAFQQARLAQQSEPSAVVFVDSAETNNNLAINANGAQVEAPLIAELAEPDVAAAEPINSEADVAEVPSAQEDVAEVVENGSIATSGQMLASIGNVSLKPKAALDSAEPIAAWTPTPVPSPTPIPTATPIPEAFNPDNTFVDEYRWIDVDLSTQVMVAYENGEPVFATSVSSGMPETPTVTGQFRIYLRLENQHMTGYHLGYNYSIPNVPFVQYFYKDYAFHGAYWHNNFGNQMSHGCVNLSVETAEWLFNFAEIGTLVNVHY